MNNIEFGFAKEDITPRYGLPLAGYFNIRPNRGAYDRLAVKAAVFRNISGHFFHPKLKRDASEGRFSARKGRGDIVIAVEACDFL